MEQNYRAKAGDDGHASRGWTSKICSWRNRSSYKKVLLIQSFNPSILPSILQSLHPRFSRSPHPEINLANMSDSKSTPNNIYPALPATEAHHTADTPPPYDGPSTAGPASGAAPRTPISSKQSYGTYSKLPSQDSNPPIVILPAPIPVENLKDTSAVVVCPHCNQCVLTMTEAHTGMYAWLC